MKLDNHANTENFFPAFSHYDKTYKSKVRPPSISTPSNFYFLLFQILVCLIFAHIFSCLYKTNVVNKCHTLYRK